MDEQHAGDKILHQDAVEDVVADVAEGVVDQELKDLSTQVAVTNLVAITGGESPTEVEHNAVITRVNLLTQVLRDAGLIPAT